MVQHEAWPVLCLCWSFFASMVPSRKMIISFLLNKNKSMYRINNMSMLNPYFGGFQKSWWLNQILCRLNHNFWWVNRVNPHLCLLNHVEPLVFMAKSCVWSLNHVECLGLIVARFLMIKSTCWWLKVKDADFRCQLMLLMVI